MKRYKLLIFILGFTNFFSCNEFEDFNENKNEPTAVTPNVLLPSTIRQSILSTSLESFLLGNNIAQLTAKSLRTEVDQYNWNAFPTVWEEMYGSLTDIMAVEQIAIDNGNEVLEGAAITMKTYVFSVLTNAYGDIPYSDAINGSEGNLTPVYDTQQSIYEDMFTELSRADNLLSSGNGSIGGDILLNNNPTMWRKFANSLHLRLLMTANSKLGDVASRFQTIVNSGNILSSNEENIILDFTENFPNQFPTRPLKEGDFKAVEFGNSAFTVMDNYNDPRLSRYARPDNDDYQNPTFSGRVNAGATQGSLLGPQYWDDPARIQASELGLPSADGIIISYAEVEFLLAEAAQRGWITYNPEVHYRAGIQASLAYYLVDYTPFGWTDFNDYYENSGVAFNNDLNQIWEQKWLALFFHGLEPYFEVRRWYFESGAGTIDQIPFLLAPPNNSNNDRLPLRFLYPGEEQSLNQANYLEAVSRLGGSDDINSSTWLTQ